MEKIRVKNTAKRGKDGGYKLAIFERDERHPGGELFIGDGKVHEVVPTPGVRMALNDERLKLVENGEGDDEPEGEAEEPESEADPLDELMAHNTKEQLKDMAEAAGIDLSSSANKEEIAQAILDAR